MKGNPSHDIFLLMLTLSQLRSPDLATALFCDSLGRLFEPVRFHHVDFASPRQLTFPVQTHNGKYGFIQANEETKRLTPKQQTLVRNAVQLLALLLEKADQERQLAEHSQSLEELVAERTAALRTEADERQRAQEALGATQRMHELVVNNLQEGIWLLDAEDKTTFTNRRMAEMLGYEREEMLGRTVQTFIAPERLAEGDAFLERRRRGIDEEHNFEFLRRDGSSLQARLATTSLFDDEGNYTGTLAGVMDIGDIIETQKELVRAKEAAEAASQAKSEFLANVSHEIRTPLNGVLGMIQLLRQTPLNEEQAEFVDTAYVSSRSLLGVLDDVLTISRMEHGRMRLNPQPFDLVDLLESLLRTFAPQARERELELRLAIPEGFDAQIVADPLRLRQILFNLMGNALKFTPTGTVGVAVQELPRLRPRAPRRLLFSVSDTGIGIPDDKLDYVFEAFTQVDGSTTRQYGGTGLGLGIVKRLVLLMNGTITVDTKQGEGTTVYFSIPTPATRRRAAASKEPPAVRLPTRPLHVLVAEDDRVNRLTIERFLRGMGHTVLCVENGKLALDALQEEDFDCVLMDIQMPVMDGEEAVGLLRKFERTTGAPRKPVIALTAHALEGDRERFLEAGMDGYLSKPVDMDTLALTLQEVAEGA